MRIVYDPKVDALSVVFRDATVTTRELADGIVAEYDAQDRLVGLEILSAATRLGGPTALCGLPRWRPSGWSGFAHVRPLRADS